MTNGTTWQFLIVDDEEEICRQVREFLEGEGTVVPDDSVVVEALTDFSEALQILESRRIDLVILDVRLGAHDQASSGEEAGINTLEAIRQRRFVPVIFYTALPNLVRNLESSLVRVVEKEPGFHRLLDSVKSIFATRLPIVNRALNRRLESVQRDYMWGFVAGHWEEYGDTPDRTDLAHFLARRFAMSLSGSGIQQLAEDLGDTKGIAAREGNAHPMQYYLIPPVEPNPLSGDIYQDKEGKYWILLTPSCDLVAGRVKAEMVLFAGCTLLSEQSEYKKWSEQSPPSNSVTKDLKCLLSNHRDLQGFQPDRFHFLPSVFMIPNLLVDFQQLKTLSCAELNNLKRLASLDSPFSQALLNRFWRYLGRLGTPDLDIDLMYCRLQADKH